MVERDRVQAHAGLGMALRLGWLLGPRQAWRVWSLARQYRVVGPAGEDNVMPHILAAVEAYATLGEVADTLREVFGEYVPATVF